MHILVINYNMLFKIFFYGIGNVFAQVYLLLSTDSRPERIMIQKLSSFFIAPLFLSLLLTGPVLGVNYAKVLFEFKTIPALEVVGASAAFALIQTVSLVPDTLARCARRRRRHPARCLPHRRI